MDESTRFLILSLAGDFFALRITSLLEITAARGITRDPGLGEPFAGQYAFRGMAIPVLDLKKLLRLPGPPGGALLVIQSGRGVAGLLADEASGIVDSAARPEPMPRGVVDPRINYYSGILRHNQELALLFNEDGLLP